MNRQLTVEVSKRTKIFGIGGRLFLACAAVGLCANLTGCASAFARGGLFGPRSAPCLHSEQERNTYRVLAAIEPETSGSYYYLASLPLCKANL
jgi:hypothetical protein